jgi:hypothetical protein
MYSALNWNAQKPNHEVADDKQKYCIYSNKRRPHFTNFNFQENTNIHIC